MSSPMDTGLAAAFYREFLPIELFSGHSGPTSRTRFESSTLVVSAVTWVVSDVLVAGALGAFAIYTWGWRERGGEATSEGVTCAEL